MSIKALAAMCYSYNIHTVTKSYIYNLTLSPSFSRLNYYSKKCNKEENDSIVIKIKRPEKMFDILKICIGPVTFKKCTCR